MRFYSFLYVYQRVQWRHGDMLQHDATCHGSCGLGPNSENLGSKAWRTNSAKLGNQAWWPMPKMLEAQKERLHTSHIQNSQDSQTSWMPNRIGAVDCVTLSSTWTCLPTSYKSFRFRLRRLMQENMLKHEPKHILEHIGTPLVRNSSTLKSKFLHHVIC